MKVIRRQVSTHIYVAAKFVQHGGSSITDIDQGAWSGIALTVESKMLGVGLGKNGEIALKFSRSEPGGWPGVLSGPKVGAKAVRCGALQLTMLNTLCGGHCTIIRGRPPGGDPTPGPKNLLLKELGNFWHLDRGNSGVRIVIR
jgi:hypothetical protein